MTTTNEIHYSDPAQVDLGDYAWRSGHRTPSDALRSLEAELETYRERKLLEDTRVLDEQIRLSEMGSALLAVS